MFYVDIFKDNRKLIHASFEDKTAAIKYFNLRIDSIHNDFMSFDRIEILDNNTCLFDYEV